MATTFDPALSDPLLSLRRAIAAHALPTPTTSTKLPSEHATNDLARATHLYFAHPIPQSIPLETATRFVSAAAGDVAVDLRSIFFAWLKKDVAIPEYIASAQELDDVLTALQSDGLGRKSAEDQAGAQSRVLNLVFVERLDLITWLEGASDESEYIRPLEGALPAAAAVGDVSGAILAGAPGAAAGPAVASGAVAPGVVPGSGGAVVGTAAGVQSVAATRLAKAIDPRLQEIYNGERKLGDRNTVLRGIKATVRCGLVTLSLFLLT
jgi:parafibromin